MADEYFGLFARRYSCNGMFNSICEQINKVLEVLTDIVDYFAEVGDLSSFGPLI
jgi:hypothetical protein